MKALMFLSLVIPALASAQTSPAPQYDCVVSTDVCENPVAMSGCQGLGYQSLAINFTAGAVTGKSYANSNQTQHLTPTAQIISQGALSTATITADVKDATGNILVTKSFSASLDTANPPNQLALTLGMNNDSKIPVSGNAFAVISALCTKK